MPAFSSSSAHPNKIMQRRLSIPSFPNDPNHHNATPDKSIIVGILGASAAYNEIHMRQLTSTIETLWGKPSRILFQQSGYSTMYIDAWAEDNKIPATAIQPEWATYGPRACMMVNARIEKESTHIVIIRSPRAKSDKMLQKAEQFASKKHKQCLVLMGIEVDESALIDHYEVPEPASTKTKATSSSKKTSHDIRNMFLPVQN
jgi:hypothetical protein